MASVIPQTEPFIREAVQANPALLSPDEGGISLRARMQCLVYAPFKAVVQRKKRVRALAGGPFLMVLDGLDECDNKDEVQELIDGMLAFFNENPLIPLRGFITSRVEEHIHSRLNVPAVRLDNLVDHCSDEDIATFLYILFEDGCRRNSVVRAYVQQHGEWPTPKDRRKLVGHIGGSFIFASAVFKFIMGVNAEGSHATTPMDRLPLALKMNPGLDGLYAETLSRSKDLPHFSEIISTIALLQAPLPTSGIAELLGIQTYEVVNVLVNLQAIIQVPGIDDIPVTLCHTSLRDFLTTVSRSGGFFAHPSHHVRIVLRCLEYQLRHLRKNPGLFIGSSERMLVDAYYASKYSAFHLNHGRGCFKLSEYNSAIHLCREALGIQPGNPSLIVALGNAVNYRANQTRSLMDFDEVVSLFRKALELPPLPHSDRSGSLGRLSSALVYRYRHTRTIADLQEAITLLREALELRPPPHPTRSESLSLLGNALLDRFERTGAIPDLEEANSLLREALGLPDPYRSLTLRNIIVSLQSTYNKTHTLCHLQEAISHCDELLTSQFVGHRDRAGWLRKMASLLQMRFNATGKKEDLAKVTALEEEATQLSASSAEPAGVVPFGATPLRSR
ncbi:hypothetical protein EST38_g8209 [Candolleomyces aberdarensis]|uniref:Uncharacterized protein n=1 Tax=Candolleomyces aberdarensis TaxID=2316362 RepID=A0A4Q2DFE0_9AGAR|nr:hypothetical protein EST38_g8209 [Candolleomyces aberdarensis]